MKRDIIIRLESWARSKTRAPLLIRGARQVGKSWVVREFGKSFKNFIELNFEKQPSYRSLFEGDINVASFLEKIALYTGITIAPNETLLFLDEIQECPNAILFLRYLKEEFPQLHVIAAGSLIDFALENIGMPVGRVDYLYLSPLSFGEFLSACKQEKLREHSLNESADKTLDGLLKGYFRTYLWLGGMPEVVKTWIELKDIEQCIKIQDRILISYQDDFYKYAKKNQITSMTQVFNAIPLQFGKKFTYSHVDNDVRASVLKNALFTLEKAGIAHICYHTSAQSPPLLASINEKYFKVFYVDIGLANRLLRLPQQSWLIEPISIDNIGGIAEQFVAQELIAYRNHNAKEQLFYWSRDSKNSSAEIDFLMGNHQLIPIEVKSGKTGRLKSINIYLQTHKNAKYGVKISENLFDDSGGIKNVPLYGIEKWLIREKLVD